jgi:hypothetical protein
MPRPASSPRHTSSRERLSWGSVGSKMRCTNGCGGRVRGPYCVSCGHKLAVVTKRAAPPAADTTYSPPPVPGRAPVGDALRFRHNDPDPAVREAAWDATWGALLRGDARA